MLLSARPVRRRRSVEKTDLFDAGEGGYAQLPHPRGRRHATGTVLAYCEARKNSRAATGATIDMLMRRSTDGGQTWDAAAEDRRAAGGREEEPGRPRAEARQAGRDHDEQPRRDRRRRRGAVHFLYCVEYARCFYVRSDDDGETFSRAASRSRATFETFRPQYDWKVLATGPGHGIRLTTRPAARAGVAVAPAPAGHAHRPSCVATIYSDDAGKTWQRRRHRRRRPELANPSETAAAELTDGRVMLNIRHEGEPHLRAVVTGRTARRAGARSGSTRRCRSRCAWRAWSRSGERTLLFTNPHNPRGGSGRTDGQAERGRRRDVDAPRDDRSGPSAYSDLAVVQAATYVPVRAEGNADARPASMRRGSERRASVAPRLHALAVEGELHVLGQLAVVAAWAGRGRCG